MNSYAKVLIPNSYIKPKKCKKSFKPYHHLTISQLQKIKKPLSTIPHEIHLSKQTVPCCMGKKSITAENQQEDDGLIYMFSTTFFYKGQEKRKKIIN